MVVPDNYVNTEVIDGYCFDPCKLIYNYQPLDDYVLSRNNGDDIFHINIKNPTKYRCHFTGANIKYKLTDIFIILKEEKKQHFYDKYGNNNIVGEIIMSHESEESDERLNLCVSIKDEDVEVGSPYSHLTKTLNQDEDGTKIILNNYIQSIPYNYYYSNDQLNDAPNKGDPNTNWIVFDSNRFNIIINKEKLLTDEIIVDNGLEDKIPEAPKNIKKIKYHEEGPEFMKTSRPAKCVPVNVPDNNKPNAKTKHNGKSIVLKIIIAFSCIFVFLIIISAIGINYSSKSNGDSRFNSIKTFFGSIIQYFASIESKPLKIFGLICLGILVFLFVMQIK